MVGDSVNSGDYTWEVTRVPIPNTTVKLSGPMIVPTSAKVGYCRIFLFKTFDSFESKVFYLYYLIQKQSYYLKGVHRFDLPNCFIVFYGSCKNR